VAIVLEKSSNSNKPEEISKNNINNNKLIASDMLYCPSDNTVMTRARSDAKRI